MTHRATQSLGAVARSALPGCVVLVLAGVALPGQLTLLMSATGNPEIVYVMLGAFGLAVVLLWNATYIALREEQVVRRWQELPATRQTEFIESLNSYKALRQVFEVMSGESRMPLRLRQSVLYTELEQFENGKASRLTIPLLLGALTVTLGLLGTLSIFSEWSVQPRNPWGALGVALMPLMYGLLSAVMLGMLIVSVRQQQQQLLHCLRQIVREREGQWVEQLEGLQRAQTPTLHALVEAVLTHSRWSGIGDDAKAIRQFLESAHDERQKVLHELQQCRRSIDDLNSTLLWPELHGQKSEIQRVDLID